MPHASDTHGGGEGGEGGGREGRVGEGVIHGVDLVGRGADRVDVLLAQHLHQARPVRLGGGWGIRRGEGG